MSAVHRALPTRKYALRLAGSLDEATRHLAHLPFDAILVQSDAGGTQLARHLAQGFRFWHEPPVIALARTGSIADAVRCIRAGARDYLPAHPLISHALRDALQRAISRTDGSILGSRLGDKEPYTGFITADYRMLAVCETVTTVADSKATLLIKGESGTGKTLLARILHERSSRRLGPFLEVNCGMLSDSLLESELFGHVRGAFTSAYRERRGKFELANGGTVLLDEVGIASPALQAKLLHAVETGRFEKVGDTRTIETDIRLVAATNISLEERVKRGLFREDLYYRLNALKVTLPPLRERVGDIPLLAQHFLRPLAEQHRSAAREISPEAMYHLVHYSWPGNVRELRNVIEHTVVLSRSRVVLPENLPERVCERDQSDAVPEGRFAVNSLRDALRKPERRHILQALRLAAGNKQHAARELGISRSTLYKKIKEHRLEGFESEPGPLALGGIGTS